MTTAAVSSVTSYQVLPAVDASMYQISFTKNTQNDTINVATYTPIKTILYVLGYDDAAGALATYTMSGTTITLTSADTGTESLIVVGLC